MTRARRPLLALAALLVAVPAATAATTVTAPKSGAAYESRAPFFVTLQIAGRSVEIAAFSFGCKNTFGRTSVNDFRLKRTDRGYRFNVDAKAIASYADDTDENVNVHMSGRFSLDAKTVRGHLRVKSRKCGDTGNFRWRAALVKR
jgi:hypothetical protein